MKIRRLVSGFIATNCYLINEGNTNILIDAEVSVDKLEKEATTLDAVLLTHAHFDHIKNLEKIVKKYNCKVYIHENGVEKLTDPHKNYSASFGRDIVLNTDGMCIETLQGGETLNIGAIKGINVIFTPGHTSCSLCFKIADDLFSGDTLFLNSIGRSDLGDGNMKNLFKSLKVIQELEYTNIYPGHGDAGKRVFHKTERKL